MSKALSASIEMTICFLSFNLLIWCITLIDLHILTNLCIPGINPTLCCMSILMGCWILFARILLRILASMFISDLKEISPEYSLEGLMLKLQYFGHLLPRTDSLEKTLMLGKIEGKRRRGRQRVRWMCHLSWRMFHVHLRRKCIALNLDRMSRKYQ